MNAEVAEPKPPLAIALHDESTRHLLRRYRRTARWELLVGVAMLVLFVWAADYVDSRAESLKEHGVRTPGEVIGFGRAKSMDVRFQTPDGGPHIARIHLDDASPDYEIGEAVVIIYDPHDIRRVRTIADDNQSPATVLPMVIALVGGVVAMLLGGFGIVRGRRWKKILAAGLWKESRFHISERSRSAPLVAFEQIGPTIFGLSSTSRMRVGRLTDRDDANRPVWITPLRKRRLVLALPGPTVLFGARAPRTRSGAKRYAKLGRRYELLDFGADPTPPDPLLHE